MHRLKHAGPPACRVDVAARSQPHASHDDCRQVGQDVAEQIAGDHHVERLGTPHKFHHRPVDQQRFGGHVGKLAGDCRKAFIPQHHAVTLRVALGDRGQFLARPRACLLERRSNDPLAAAAREQPRSGWPHRVSECA